MKQLAHILKWELLLLHRNQLIIISLAIAGIYLGVFFLLKDLGHLENLLIVLIYNDPVITGYMFAGVLILFEKNQNTLEALSVSPLSPAVYLWSKALSLALIATLTALMMVWIAHGWQLQYLHFFSGVVGSAMLFVWAGCMLGLRSAGFNHLMIRTIAFLVPVALPYLMFFGVWDSPLLYVIPSYPGILLLKAAFQPLPGWQYVYSYAYLLFSLVMVYRWTVKTFEKR